jgi:cell division protein FtsZ
LTLFEVNEASTLIQEAAHEDANIIFGSVIDENMRDEVKITVIATGFDRARATTYPQQNGRGQAYEPGYRSNVDPRDYPAYMRRSTVRDDRFEAPVRPERPERPLLTERQQVAERQQQLAERQAAPAQERATSGNFRATPPQAAPTGRVPSINTPAPAPTNPAQMDRSLINLDDAEIDIPAFLRRNAQLSEP